MNPFASLQKDTVFIESSSGDRAGLYKVAIGTKGGLSASICESALDVEEG